MNQSEERKNHFTISSNEQVQNVLVTVQRCDVQRCVSLQRSTANMCSENFYSTFYSSALKNHSESEGEVKVLVRTPFSFPRPNPANENSMKNIYKLVKVMETPHNDKNIIAQ